jgi:hypothetical protein
MSYNNSTYIGIFEDKSNCEYHVEDWYFINRLNSSTVANMNLYLHQHLSWSVLCSMIYAEFVVRVVDIGGIVVYHVLLKFCSSLQFVFRLVIRLLSSD